MQFKHPEILYALFTLLIPVFIHLFQLQRFTKIPFTNVSFLKEIELQTRKSSKLKKWLVLLSRLLAFAAIIVAFAQPFFSKNDTSKEWFTAIYLDNSLSMQAKGEQGELLKRAIHDLAISIPEEGTYTLLTNNEIFNDLTSEGLKDQLKNISYSPLYSDLNTILFKSRQVLDKHTDQHQKLLLVSDFQHATQESKIKAFKNNLLNQDTKFDFVQLKAKLNSNVAIDSVSILKNNLDDITLKIILKNQGQSVENISLSAIQNDTIIAKTTVSIPENKSQNIAIQIPENSTNISLKIDFKDRYNFDNEYFVSVLEKEKIKVLLLTEANSFLERIYTEKEFDLYKRSKDEISFDLINKQNLIVLEGLKSLTNNLLSSLLEFVNKGGSLVLIPNVNDKVEDINLMFNQYGLGQLSKKLTDSLYITKIHFSHPLLKNVFQKEVHNFQYPYITTYFEGSLKQGLPILSFENQKEFISQFKKHKGAVFWVAAPLDKNSSNFTNAPLVVPVFYNIAKQSVQQMQVSYSVGVENKIVVPAKLQKDAVLHITNSQTDFIPQQLIRADKVFLFTNDQPQIAGFYEIKNENTTLQNLAFNYTKDESLGSFYTMNTLSLENTAIHSFNTIKEALSALSAEQNSTAYFKWFVLLALLFLFIEILLLKYL